MEAKPDVWLGKLKMIALTKRQTGGAHEPATQSDQEHAKYARLRWKERWKHRENFLVWNQRLFPEVFREAGFDTFDLRLSWIEECLYRQFYIHSNCIWETHTDFARRLRVSRQTIGRCMKSLVSKGLLKMGKWKPPLGKWRLYYVLTHPHHWGCQVFKDGTYGW